MGRRGPKPSPETRRRERKVRFSPEEWARAVEQSELREVTPSKWIRERAQHDGPGMSPGGDEDEG